MVRKRLRAVLALIVAMMFVLQATPVMTFATESDPSDEVTQETSLAAEASNEEESSSDEEILNFAIDSEGNRVELADDYTSGEDEYTAATPEPVSSSLYYADEAAFYDYDNAEVSVAGEKVAQEISFENYSDGDTDIDGLITRDVSAKGYDLASTMAVTTVDGEKVFQLSKQKNGAKTSGGLSAGDEGLFAILDLDTPLEGILAFTAEVYVEAAGRMGIFFYQDGDDPEAVADSLVSDTTITSPYYLGRGFFWDTGGDSRDPAVAEPAGIAVWTRSSGAYNSFTDTTVSYTTGAWYTLRCDLDSDEGTYDFYIYDESGTAIASKTDLTISPTASTDGIVVGGMGITVSNTNKSLGTIDIKNMKVIDNNSAKQDAEDVTADTLILSLPTNLDASAVSSNFYVDLAGTYGSEITWASSNTTLATVDNSTGLVSITRPAFTGAGGQSVTLTATVEKGGASSTKEFVITVLEQSPETNEECVEADANLLSLPSSITASSVTDDFTMPVTGSFGSTITYTTSDNSVVSINNSTGVATVTAPAYTGEGGQTITITATITKGGVTLTKELEVTVIEAEPATDAEKALYDVTNAYIGGVDLTNIRQDSFYLDDVGTYGTLSWVSNDTEHVAIDVNYENEDVEQDDGEGNADTGEVYADGYIATVTRPGRGAATATVIVTVTSTVNGATASADFTLSIIPEDDLKAYPGVEGYGAYSEGGRGGKVYHVTTLAADGEGSLRYGLESVQGARTIVFDVGGVIDLTSIGDTITIKGEKYSNVTIAGQTAPYPGITLKGWGLTISSAHDVIVRNIRFRMGDVEADGVYYQSDPLSIGSSTNVIIDHCSLEWAIDMSFRATGQYITMSNNIMGKSLLENSPHEKGGHAYVGMINEGAVKVSYIKNLVDGSTQRSPRITDANYVDSYNCLLYDCGNGYDLFNYEWQDKNSKMNVYNNYARKGPNQSNNTPYRAGRGRDYSGGVMVYYTNNYTASSATATPSIVSRATNYSSTIQYVLDFGSTNDSAGIDLSSITLDEWDADERSYDNNGKTTPAATLTYMTYPFPAPRGEVLDVMTSGTNNVVEYAIDDNGMGATRPARDLYDTMLLYEMQQGTSSSATLSEEEVTPFFEALEARTGRDYSAYKTSRTWTVQQGAGPVLNGATSTIGSTKPVHWDDYTDTNKNAEGYDSSKYASKSVTNFEVGDWWGEYTGSPGQETKYTLYDTVLNRTVTTTDSSYDGTRYELISEDKSYIAVERTVSDLVPADWVVEGYPEIAAFMDKYREENYPGKTDPESENYNPSYKIAWDAMGDGIPNWYKEYRGWSTSQYLANAVDSETGYTYLEEYLQFMADDQELETNDDPASIENFNVNNLGYSTAQVYWNTDYRATCVIEYGTEPGVYTNQEILSYDETTDYYHTYHAQTLIDLEPSTAYYYKVTAVDENGTVSTVEYDPEDEVGATMTFTTTESPSGASTVLPSKPEITNKVPYLEQVRLNWTGDVQTDESYEIYYDTTNHGTDYTEYANKITGIDSRTYKQVITGLTNNTTYYFIVVAVNSNGRTSSDVVSEVPSGRLLDFDFTTMTEEEQEAYLKDEFMYVLGGNVTIQEDPDTGETVLQMLDETNSHGVNADNKLARTQDELFTYEVKLKVLWQKQTDALNQQANIDGDGENEHNTFQLNFYMDAIPSEDMDSTNSVLWDSAFTVYLDASSRGISESNGRYDGTTDTGTLKFGTTSVGSYKLGTTTNDTSNAVVPVESSRAYANSYYSNKTVFGDCIYSTPANTDKTLHALWYYELGSSEFITFKIVIDPENNNVKLYMDDDLVWAMGEFSEDLEEPFNIGKVQLKSRNDGYSWVNVASIRAYTGETYVSPNDDGVDTAPTTSTGTVSSGTISSTTGSSGGGSSSGISGGGFSTGTATATPAPTDAEATATMNPDTNKYFNDLGDVQWAVDSINALAEMGIVNGVGDGEYAPERSVSRAEYTTMLVRAFEDSITAGESSVAFSDVEEGEWYYDSIMAAASLGIVNGYEVDGVTEFGVDDVISREDMMVIAYRTLLALGKDIPATREYVEFADAASISDYAVEAVEKMYCAEIINGVGDNMLDPKGTADRAQAAKIMYGLVQI